MLRQPVCLIMLILSLPKEGDSKCSLTCNADPIPHYYSTAQNWVCRMKRTKRILNSSETFGFALLGTKHVTVTLYLSTVLHRVLSRDSNNVPPIQLKQDQERKKWKFWKSQENAKAVSQADRTNAFLKELASKMVAKTTLEDIVKQLELQY